jgi:hypothetical protein
MKLYLTASLIAISALTFIAANQPPAQAAAIAVAAAGGWPDEAATMARRTGPRWLLRAMPAAASAGTLATLPDDERAKTQSL